MAANEQANFSVPEAADFLRCHPNHVRNLVARGELCATEVGRRIIISRSEIQRFLLAHTRPGIADAR
jgi:excisionase family DNA binding protein